ncbi:hypothetical protein AN641_04280 [Candidatus Epulonipiscioides gigas]|nr:hypothetical protein AN641_04280 [Epulopiscium sp. SCG-C07WGA-EpuloA2]
MPTTKHRSFHLLTLQVVFCYLGSFDRIVATKIQEQKLQKCIDEARCEENEAGEHKICLSKLYIYMQV